MVEEQKIVQKENKLLLFLYSSHAHESESKTFEKL